MENLRVQRDLIQYTRTRLARESGVSQFRIAMCELEGQPPRPEEIEALNRVLQPELMEVARLALELTSDPINHE